MIQNIEITGVKYSPDKHTLSYVRKKIGSMERYVPKHARESLFVEVKLKQIDEDHGNKYECDVIMRLPDHNIAAKDSTMNMLAAIDIVEEKLKIQLKKYHDESVDHRAKHNMVGRIKRRVFRPQLDA